ncbi:anthranilate O-methyltransferase 1-like [Ananas comosus]|uniref:Anthranilate O-methyltransferase 1-like n=1 Tax=Ananas comosus TaxID=4615 RepID=A0A6P5F1J0_ANACO|nr:anthranilate O-methyltransferase 1-like [Ananas comosus]
MRAGKAHSMVGGGGETSYATNSRLQEKAILETKPILEEVIGEICRTLLPKSMVAADLGCSSGPNTLLMVSEVIKTVADQCKKAGRPPPDLQFFLNDLPTNDFNNIFRSLEWFEQKMDKKTFIPYYIAGLPGSFYGRLFPPQSVHFFHSSYCLMWLRQILEGLKSKTGTLLDEGNIYIGETSPPWVVNLYAQEFKNGFSNFLNFRHEELASGGQMVLTFLGSEEKNLSIGDERYIWGLLQDALHDMVSEGLVEREKLYCFKVPMYTPSMAEVKEVIQEGGLFDISRMQYFESNWDPFDDSCDDFVLDNLQSGANVAKCIRAVAEPLISSHFGEGILDELFSRYANNIARHLLKGKAKYHVLVFALKRRG